MVNWPPNKCINRVKTQRPLERRSYGDLLLQKQECIVGSTHHVAYDEHLSASGQFKLARRVKVLMGASINCIKNTQPPY